MNNRLKVNQRVQNFVVSPIFALVAVDKLPNFSARPNESNGMASDHHRCTIHINTESIDTIEKAFADFLQGKPSDR